MITKDETVLVTGVISLAGSHLIKELTKTGHSIRVLAREFTDSSTLDGLSVDWYGGEVYLSKVVKKAKDGANFYPHVVSAYRGPRRQTIVEVI